MIVDLHNAIIAKLFLPNSEEKVNAVMKHLVFASRQIWVCTSTLPFTSLSFGAYSDVYPVKCR